jgi:hypothetical protein
MIDILPIDGGKPIDAYRQIRAELEQYSPKLAAKPELLAANKMDLAGASEALADLRSELPGKQIFAISAVAGTGLRPLLEALWQQVQKAPESAPLVEERPYIPPAQAKKRSDDEMFEYAEAEANEGDWEPVDGDLPLEPDHSGFINAAGEEVPAPAKPPTRRELRKIKRKLIEPAPPKKRGKGGERITAKERKSAHATRVKAKSSPAPEPQPVDAELEAEIQAIKADDKRKGKYYNRRKSDI